MTGSPAGPGPSPLSVLRFRVADAVMAVRADAVQEVTRAPPVTRVPHAPPCVLGVSNLRGQVMPVVSTARLLEAKEGEASGTSRTIVLNLEPPLALAVDEVLGLSTMDAPADGAGALFVEDDAVVRAIDLRAALDRAFGVGTLRAGGSPQDVTVGRVAAGSTPAIDETHLFLTFAVGGQVHALAVDVVEEVMALPDSLAALPHGAQADLGVIPYRNGVLPVVDLAALLGLERRGGVGKLVVVRLGEALAGLRVDGLDIIRRVARADVTAVPALLNCGGGEAAIAGIVRLDRGRVVSVLTPERLFRAEALEKIMADGRRELEIATVAADAETESFLLFQLGEETYGLPLSDVQEVVAVPEVLTRVPHAPAFIEGVMNLRGQVIPVIDQTRRFGATRAAGAARKVIVTRSDTLWAGFIVDAVSAVRAIPRRDLAPSSDLLSGGRRVFDRVVQSAEGEVMLIVDPGAMLEQAEADLLAALTTGNGTGS
ncbi:chemotaxis protein CheW [Brevundimonas sp. R86498]|uniref:chemotaxis protein CheW n=1 Tax=Brevundimonas sp. R86498 TaxID=3093845 RepID=UPI0037C51F77